MNIVSGVVDTYYSVAAHATTALWSTSDFQSAKNIKPSCTMVTPFHDFLRKALGAIFGLVAVAGFIILLLGLVKFLASQKKRGDAASQMIGGFLLLLLFGGGSAYFFGFLSGFGMSPPCL